jgi:DNA-directed RNA polymerase II subunit RPB1
MDNPIYAYDRYIKPIERIDFDVLSNEEIKNRSAFGRDNAGVEFPDLYENNEPRKGGLADPRLGTIDINTNCATCGFDTNFCPGHTGHMDLIEPFFHIGYLAHIKKILDCICIKCSRILIHKNEKKISEILKTKSGKLRLAEVYNAVKNITNCQKCGSPVRKIRIERKKKTASILVIAELDLENIKDENLQLQGKKKLKETLTSEVIYDKLKNISDDDCRILGMEPERTRPENMIHTVFLIPPLAIRPAAKGDYLGGSLMEDGLTHRLVDIVRSNFKIVKQKETGEKNMSKFLTDPSSLLCQFNIGAYFDKDQISSPATVQKERSLAPGIKGKEGRIRGNLMGKRTDFTARTVITSNPVIDFNEVCVPVKIAMTLTFPEVVSPANIDYLKTLVKNGRYNYPGANWVFPVSKHVQGHRIKPFDLRVAEYELHIGDVVERHLQSGDIVVLNRQPTLHKQSMMGHKIKVINNPDLMTFGLSGAVTKPYNADFDGDEMNIFVPQSLQSQIELEELVDVKKQIISPSSSRTSIGLIQDSLLSSYNLTSPTMRINWRNCMNIISYTSFEKFDTYKKDKQYTGHELFTMIIPPGINISKDDLKIKDSILSQGRLSKDVLGEKKNFAIHQLIWDEYGSDETKRFIDNAQRLLNNFNLYNGFTVGYGDACIDEPVKRDIDKLFLTTEHKVNNMIANIENNPNIMEKDVFEFKLLQQMAVLPEVKKLVMKSLKAENNFKIMVSSGSKGSEENIGQICGSLGFLAVEGKLVQKKYNKRTLAYFHQNDDRPRSRGLIRQPFIEGVDFPGFTYVLMAGREGCIDGAIKTAVTGYAQRRLIKCMEDSMVKYDCSVRTANNSILQLVYGDSGADTTKQYAYNFKLVELGNKELEAMHKFTDAEMKEYKNYKDNDKVFSEIKEMRDNFRICMKKAKCDFKAINTSVNLPINLNRIINSNVNNKSLMTGEKVQPDYVRERLEAILENSVTNLMMMSDKDSKNKKSIKNLDERTFKTFLKTALYDALSPKMSCINKNLTKKQFDSIIDEIIQIYNKSIVQPGDMIGILSAQAIVEPLTQMTLNSFHSAGLSTMNSTTKGVPRVQEILGVSKAIKTPQLIIHLEDKYKKSKEMAHKIKSNLKYTTFGDVRGRINVYFDPYPEEDDSIMKSDGVTQVYYNQKASKNSCQSNITGLPWLMRIEIIKEKMIEKEVYLLDIKSKFCNWWETRYNDMKNLKKEEKKVINKITALAVMSNSDNDVQPVIHVRFNVKDGEKNKDPFSRETLNDFIDHIIDKFKLKGIDDIKDVPNIATERCVSIDENEAIKYEDEQVIYTIGANMTDIRYIVGIDLLNTISNDVYDVYKTFGIEVARSRLLREIDEAFQSSGAVVSYTHICILADIMTSAGTLMSIDRHGMGKSDADVLGRASFEKPIEHILSAAVFNESDTMKGVSARVMAGAVIKSGTGYCDVILDTDLIENSEYTAESKYKQYTEVIEDSIAKDIINKDNEDIFIPM